MRAVKNTENINDDLHLFLILSELKLKSGGRDSLNQNSPTRGSSP